MRILIDEFIVGGGMAGTPLAEIPPSLLREGRAMLSAVATDFARIPGVQPVVLLDERFGDLELPGCEVVGCEAPGDEIKRLVTLVREVDWTLVIAPEFDELLHARCLAVEAVGGRLLGPSSSFVEWAADKHATAETLRRHGVRAPRGICLQPGEEMPADFPLLAVFKPRYGAGSLGVETISTNRVTSQASRLEERCPGTPVSCAIMRGGRHPRAMLPCLQKLGGKRGFEYLGGELLIDPDLKQRTLRLFAYCVDALPPCVGWIGVDMVLGPAEDGTQDFVIEVNPRLTTSYVGLRAAATVNLAEAMWKIAEGEEFDMDYDNWRTQVRWTADGDVDLPEKRKGRGGTADGRR